MNKFIRAAFCVPVGMIKMAWIKMFHFSSFSGPIICLISPFSEITIERGAELRIGKGFKMRDGAKLRVRKGATCILGKNVSINSNNIIACRERIEIGDDVQLSPNVQIYDHDHDYQEQGGIKAGKYKTSAVKIGSNTWIGANVVVMRGTDIGDNTVIGAGAIIKAVFPPDSVIIQKRETEVR